MAALNPTTKMDQKSPKIAMHWFRKGLRLTDNAGLMAAAKDAEELYPCYICDGDSYQLLHCSALRANFLVECLQDLYQQLSMVECSSNPNSSLNGNGNGNGNGNNHTTSRLYVDSGDPTIVLPKLWEQFRITHMTFEQDETGEPYAKERDQNILRLAKQHNIQIQSFPTETLFPLQDYVTKSGTNGVPNTMGSFATLFNKMGPIPQPLQPPLTLPGANPYEGQYLPPKKPTDLPWPRNVPKSQLTPIWGPNHCKKDKITPILHGGETNALRQLRSTITARPTYVATFEKPKTSCTALSPSTTGISPYMSLGCLSPRTVWYAIQESSHRSATKQRSKPPVSLHGQLMWRDFNNLIAHSANQYKPASWSQIEGNIYCRQIPWDQNDKFITAWKTAQTGYPWIDACMKQLEQEGWIHHLGRHAVACFLTRGDLWQSWEVGAQHFESHLLDADYALNGFNWLWLSCSGFFYQYFRCYSPIAFQKKNDPRGEYIRKYLPVLAKLPSKYIYEPWKAPPAVQATAGIKIGVDYPKPIVDHGPVSKENMSRMAAAYKAHKAKQQQEITTSGRDTKKISSKAKGNKNSTTTTTTTKKEGSQRTAKRNAASKSGGGKDEPKKRKTKQSKINF